MRSAATAGAVGIVALMFTAPSAGSMPSECREVTCSATISVGESTVKWVSPETFYPANETVYAGLATDRGPLTLTRSFGAGPCKHRFFGAGTSVTVKACGQTAQLRLVAVRVKRGNRNLTITYSASPASTGRPSRRAAGRRWSR